MGRCQQVRQRAERDGRAGNGSWSKTVDGGAGDRLPLSARNEICLDHNRRPRDIFTDALSAS